MPETKQRNGIRVFHGFDALPRFVRPAVTVGSYDGVHRGHRALIERLVAEARAAGGESIVLTFEPHPRITLGRGEGLRLLTTLDEKIALLGDLGVDNVIVIPFDRADCDAFAATGRLRVVKVEPCTVDGVRVSSTLIRRLLEEGKTAQAARLRGGV